MKWVWYPKGEERKEADRGQMTEPVPEFGSPRQVREWFGIFLNPSRNFDEEGITPRLNLAIKVMRMMSYLRLAN
jgi:hypothetical protein